MTARPGDGGWQRPHPEQGALSRPFWEAAANQRLVLQYCVRTGRFQHYPRPVSIYCGGRELEWREVSGKGSLYAFTITRRPPPAFAGQEPYVVALVDLDEGVRFMSSLVNCDINQVRTGMRVRVTWRQGDAPSVFPLFEPYDGA
jgi:uncharacterized OB-fold protein